MNKIKIKEYVDNNCPICYSANFSVLPFYSIRFDTEKKGKVSICEDCSHVFISKRWSEDSYNQFYEEEYRNAVGFNKTSDEELFFEDTKLRGVEVVNFVSQYLKKDAKILEVGCGNGGILMAFKEAGFNNVQGIDPNIEETRLANSKYGIDVINGPPNFENIPNKTYDCILIVASIDHFTKPREYLEKLKDKIKDCGYLFIDGHDVEAQMNLGTYVPKMDHPSYFSGLTIRSLLKLCGYNLIKFSRNLNYFSPLYYFQGNKKDSRVGFQVLAQINPDKDKFEIPDVSIAVSAIKNDFKRYFSYRAKVLKKLLLILTKS